MRLIVMLTMALVVVACSPSRPTAGQQVELDNNHLTNVTVWHDDDRLVTCWILGVDTSYGGRGGISCLPDHEVSHT